ncbi:peptidyl-prolyl cis-trans isomerase, putative [Plasmodium sp. DRC-Itaito]|nr:peptidyl-prolyl cis-trans isomerase, putative [Plasmodium sp. DRC-Itaito]
MVVKTSDDVYNFVKDSIKIKEELDNQKKVKKPEKKICELKNKPSKYELDYSKFEECINDIENEEKEEKHREEHKHDFINNKNPCSHDHSKERQLYEKSTKEKIKASNIFNEEGKKAFYEKNYKLACVYFRKGLIQLDYSFPDSNEEENEQRKLEINLHLNMALTKFHMSKFYECISECSTVLNFDKDNIKAYYRKGQAYMSLDLYDDAKREFLKVLEINPNDNNTKKALIILRQKIIIYNKKKKLVCAKFFSTNEKDTSMNKKEEYINDNSSVEKNELNMINQNINKNNIINNNNTIDNNKNHIHINKNENNFFIPISNIFKKCSDFFVLNKMFLYIYISFSLFFCIVLLHFYYL